MADDPAQPDVAPPPLKRVQPLSDGERARAERLFHLQRFSSGLAGYPIDGTILVQFATALGFTEFHFGIVGGLSQWLQYGSQLLAAIISERGQRKRIAVTGATLRALIIAGFAVLAWRHPTGGFVVPLLLAMVLLVRSQQGVQGSTIIAWMRDVSGARHWSRSASTRLVLGRLALPLTLLYAATVDWGRHRGGETFFLALAGCYGVAALWSAIGAWSFAATPDPRVVWHDPEPPVESLPRRILRNRAVRRYVVFMWLVSLGMATTQVFRGYYQVNVIGLSQMEIALASSVIGALAAAGATYAYRHYSARVSDRALLICSSAGALVVAGTWVFAIEWRWLFWVLIPAQAVLMCFRALGGNWGVLLQITPGHRRGVYLAVINLVGSLPLFVSPLVGKWMHACGEQTWRFAGRDLSAIQLAMVLGMVFYAGAAVMAWKGLITERNG